MITPNSYMNPEYTQAERDRVSEYMSSGGWIMEHKLTRELEDKICEYTNSAHAHMVTSATAGLHIAAMIAGIRPGVKFAASAYTQAATVNGAISLGGVPCFVDISQFPFYGHVIDFKKIPSDCGVVFVTSINGRLSKDTTEEIIKLQSQGVMVIEDSAQSLGSFHDGKHVGTLGDMGVFSFGAPKMITTGQGGCIVTDCDDISDQIKAIKNFGRTVADGEIYNTMGLNYKFTDLQAAFGLGQFERLQEIVDHKKQIYEWYRTHLKGHAMFVGTNLHNTAPIYPEILTLYRDEIIESLKLNNIGYRIAYQPLTQQPFHSQFEQTDIPNAETIARRGLHLPSQHSLTYADVSHISEIVKRGILC
jgi:perosamine synthetase